MTKARSKILGETVEGIVFEDVDELEPAEVPLDWDRAVDDYWHDASPTVALFASELVPMVGICVIEPGQPVEVKAARAVISDGPNTRYGRFNLTRKQHERLLKENGVYLFVIYSGDDEPELLGLLAVPAVIVEEELRPKWYSVDGREDYYQVAASRLPIDGLGGDRDE